jgi:signal transduction histidine kinase
MSVPAAPAHGSWRLPRRTVRLKLTMLYGALFLVSGAVLLAVTYFLVAQKLPAAAAISTHSAGASGIASQQVCFVAGAGGGGGSGAALPSPLPSSGSGCAILLSQYRASELRQLLTDSAIALAIMAAASIGLGWLVAGRVLQPLRTITTAARRISASNLHQRLALAGPDDELRELGKTFNGLLARLEESFAAQRQFVANASHELRTPLARQRTLLEVALRDSGATARSLRATMRRVLVTGEQQERLIEALLTLARSQRGLDRREPVDLADVTGDALAASEPGARDRGLRVHAALGPAPALGDRRLAERLAANLVDNAVRHNVAGGSVEVTTGVRAGRGFLSVANTGPVIPPQQVEELFRPFGRLEATRLSRDARDGLGLGLSIVTAIAAAHDADLRARPRPGGGLEVEVDFPRLPGEAARPGEPASLAGAEAAAPGDAGPPGEAALAAR